MPNDNVEMVERGLQKRLETYLPLARRFLLNDLELPAQFVGSPHELRCYINGKWTHLFLVMERSILPLERVFGADAVKCPQQGACFQPGEHDAIMFMPDLIAAEAEEAGITPAALTEILIAHECLHATMMAHLNPLKPGPGRDWVSEKKFRFIHEALALRFCAELPRLTDGRILEEDVQRYLDFVELKSKTGPDGYAYSPYFDQYAGEPNTQFWRKLSAGLTEADMLPG